MARNQPGRAGNLSESLDSVRIDHRGGLEGPDLVGTDNVIEQFQQLRVFQDLSDHFGFAVGESGNRLGPYA
jgi:hypothetical protein